MAKNHINKGMFLILFPFCIFYSYSSFGQISIRLEKDYDAVFSFSEGLAVAIRNEKAGFIDKTGKEVIPCIYDRAGNFSEGLAAVRKKDGKVGYVDKTGKVIIPFEYNDGKTFIEGLAIIKNNNGWYGFIDKTGKEVVTPIYEDVYSFSEGLAPVKYNGKWGLLENPLENQDN
jgi:hypothetical protein